MSGIFFSGPPGQIVDAWKGGRLGFVRPNRSCTYRANRLLQHLPKNRVQFGYLPTREKWATLSSGP
jgi:hypothetical protein